MATPSQEHATGYRVFHLTDKIHETVYPAVSPTQPALSQEGKTILVTGGSGGIGYAIANAFRIAGASRVIIVGRDEGKVNASVKQLTRCSGQSSTVFEGRVCQIHDPASIDNLWTSLEKDEAHIDVLVLNAAMTDVIGKMWQLGWKRVWDMFEVNVRSSHHFCERFQQQKGHRDSTKYVVNVSTSSIHDWPANKHAPAYGLTKNSATLLMQQLASETEASQLQIVSFHPGAILTPGARALGLDETSMNWDDEQLPAAVAVWAATPEASFLHGRFIWASWDVEELRDGGLRECIENDGNFLRIGVCGLDRVPLGN